MRSPVTDDSPGTQAFLSGNEAIARGCIEAGVSLVTGYPGTPTTPVIEILERVGSRIRATWSVNEKVALDVAMGNSWAGKRSLVTMKMTGLNVASDSFLSLAASGTVGGLVLYVGDDPNVYYGMVEQDSRYYALLASAPMLVPANPQEMLDFTRFAFDLSEKIEGPVLLRSTTVLSNTFGRVTLGDIRRVRQKAHFSFNVEKYTKAGSVRCRRQHQEALARVEAAGELAEALNVLTLAGSDVGVVASSTAWDYLDEVLHKNGLDLTRLKVSTAHPVPRGKIRKVLENCRKVLVLEELEPVIEAAVRAEASLMDGPPRVFGKEDALVARVGDLSPDQVRDYLSEVLGENLPLCPGPGVEEEAAAMAVRRLLTFCAGCPHRSSYFALLRAMKELGLDPSGVVVTGDIGCTILGMNEPFSICWTEVSMGSGIALAEGFLEAGMPEPVVATIGDGTFFHAGIPPVVNAVSSGRNLPVVVLDNNWSAMTGFQDTPGTLGQGDPKVSIEGICRGLGVRSVKVVNPYRYRTAVRAFRRTLRAEGVNVLVMRAPCAARQPGKWDLAIRVNPKKCPGFSECKRTCIEALACPAILRDGDEVRIDPEVCQSCGLCVHYCPENAIRGHLLGIRRRKSGI